MHPPDRSAMQANLETVGDHVHLVVALRPLAALDPVEEFLPPSPLVVGRSLVQDPLPVDPYFLQRVKTKTTWRKTRGSS